MIGVQRPSVRLSVCLMSRTSALTRKPKGLGRRNFAQGYPRSHATPTPTSRSKGQKSRSRGAGAYCGGDLAAQLVIIIIIIITVQPAEAYSAAGDSLARLMPLHYTAVGLLVSGLCVTTLPPNS